MSKCGFRRGGLICNLELGHPGGHWAGAVAAVYPAPREYDLTFDVGATRREFIAQHRFRVHGFRTEGDIRGASVSNISVGLERQLVEGLAPVPLEALAREKVTIHLSIVHPEELEAEATDEEHEP